MRNEYGTWERFGDGWGLVDPSPLKLAVSAGGVRDSDTVTVDHGDGTGTRTTYRPDGTVDTVEQLTGLPIPDPEPPADDPLAAVTALLAQVTPDQLARVLALGVAVTEPESVARLATAVETGDLTDGIAVVAEAAVTAQVSVEGV